MSHFVLTSLSSNRSHNNRSPRDSSPSFMPQRVHNWSKFTIHYLIIAPTICRLKSIHSILHITYIATAVVLNPFRQIEVLPVVVKACYPCGRWLIGREVWLICRIICPEMDDASISSHAPPTYQAATGG